MNDVSIVGLEGDGIKGFNPISYRDNPTANMIGSPVESGAINFDNKVIQPRKITITGYVLAEEISSVLDKLNQMLKDKSFTFYSIVTKDSVLTNMAVVGIQNNGNNDKYDAVEVEVEFQEVLMDDGLGFTSQDGGNSNTTEGGMKQ